MRPHLLFITCILIAAEWCAAGVQDLTPENFDSVVDGSKNVFVRFYAPWSGHCKHMAPEYKKVGKAFSGIDDVIIAQVDGDLYRDLATRIDLKGFPTLIFFPKGSNTFERYEGNRDANSIINFINDKAGTNVKWSAPLSNVVILTPKNFDEIVLDTSKDVLVKFYAPWSGHCKALAPMYDQLADIFEKDKHIVIAKFDTDQSAELPSKYGARGYPSFIFFPKSDKTGLLYESGRDLKSFVDYLNEKTGTYRKEDGRLNEKAGRVAALDALAKEFMAAAQDDLGAIIVKAEAARDVMEKGSLKDYAWDYIAVMKKAAMSGKDYIKEEAQRIDNELAKEQYHLLDSYTRHKNILSAFLNLA